MPMGWVAAAAAIAGLAGSAMQSDAAKSAGGTQAGAANRATDAQLQMFNTLNTQGAPYREAGVAGLNKLKDLLGISQRTYGPSTLYTGQTPLAQSEFDPAAYNKAYWDVATNPGQSSDPYAAYIAEGRKTGTYRPAYQLNTTPPPGGVDATTGGNSQGYGSLLQPFTAPDLYLSPTYQFEVSQGLGQTLNAMNARGGNMSGNTLRGLVDYATGKAGQSYGQAFDIYNAQQTNIFNRLASIAGIGQQANATTAGAGTAISGNAAQSMMNAGASAAAGQIGSANALAGGLNNAGSWYYLSQLTKKPGGGGGGTTDSTYGSND